MFRCLYPLLLLGGLSFCLSAQTLKNVAVKTERTNRSDESIVKISATNENPESVTLRLHLKNTSYRMASDRVPVVKTIKYNGSKQLVTLHGCSSAGYSSLTVPGCLEVEPRPVKYLLPVGPGKATTAYSLSNLGEKYFDETAPKNWASYAFSATAGDTIFAARRGEVIRVEDGNAGTTKSVEWTANRNYLIVEHEDCTRGKYEMFARKGVFVQVGATVEAGDPLGVVAAGDAYSIGDHLRFSVYYAVLNRELVLAYRSQNTTPLENSFVRPDFVTSEREGPLENQVSCTAVHTEELIHQEMRKSEIKRWRKRKKKQ